MILLNEIQECPRARTAIKFLVEDGRLGYIETSSSLGVKTRQVPSYPMGFEGQYRMYPLDFEEYRLANGVQQSTIDMLRGQWLRAGRHLSAVAYEHVPGAGAVARATAL